MGIIANAKQYLEKKATSVALRAADGVAKAAILNPRQIQQVVDKQDQYLSEIPNMNDDQAREFISRKIGTIGIEVYQAYLEQLKTLYQPLAVPSGGLDALNRIRYFNITKWVTDPTEKNLDKLVNVYQVLSKENCNIALIYNRLKSGCQVVIAVSNTDEDQCDPAVVDSFYNRLSAAIKGNFPGVEIAESSNSSDDYYGYGIPDCLKSAIEENKQGVTVKSVATVSNLVSDKSENFISQSMEKLLDGITPKTNDEEYTLILLARPVSDQLNSRNRLFELYSELSPYASWQTNYSYSESNTTGASASIGVNLGLAAGVNGGVRNPIQGTKEKVTHAAVALATGGESVGVMNGGNSGSSGGYHLGANFGVNFARASTVTVQIGKNEGITQTYTNYSVKHTLEILEKQLERIDASSALGMWEFASYVISSSPVVANNVAHMYLALTQGEGSFISSAAVHLWDGEEEKDQAATILESIQKIAHPVFGLRDSSDNTVFMYPVLVTPTTTLSGKELAKALNFPRKSVSGLPVFECVPFGREVILHSAQKQDYTDLSSGITLGSIYHMRLVDENAKVILSKNSLTAHTFITGSTGAGKSNAIYTMLNGLCPPPRSDAQEHAESKELSDASDIHFLVIEPAKGEYKDIFGGRSDVQVYGTNSRKAPLLQLNPFSFPDDTHVLEHIDRLVEVFNACWPMFAAMPAVLKASIEAAYTECGWNLKTSTNANLQRVFPTFRNVMKALPNVVDSKGFSSDTQGDYKGALLTRIESLTNGINGQILCAAGDEIPSKKLFGENVIIDLSRVGSQETKALLMGMLVLKLQEYRMEERSKNGQNDIDNNLRHITVLEEAHNLLRRTSTEQSQDSSNLQGKSVEMLTNAIAEMRTYGEGFIIADQAPGLLDMAVIRNTNTKIILRLPDESDRTLVGKAAGLNDDQIVELSRLDTGVAAVYQNHWLEPVLCKVSEFTSDQRYPFDYAAVTKENTTDKVSTRMNIFFGQILHTPVIGELTSEDADNIRNWIENLQVGRNTKFDLLGVLNAKRSLSKQHMQEILYRLAGGNDFLRYAGMKTDRDAASRVIDQSIMERLSVSSQIAKEIRQQIFLYAASQIDREQLASQYQELLQYGGVR